MIETPIHMSSERPKVVDCLRELVPKLRRLIQRVHVSSTCVTAVSENKNTMGPGKRVKNTQTLDQVLGEDVTDLRFELGVKSIVVVVKKKTGLFPQVQLLNQPKKGSQ